MKLHKETLLEIMSVVQHGLSTGTDISQGLRDLDLEEHHTSITEGPVLRLTEEYLKLKGRERVKD